MKEDIPTPEWLTTKQAIAASNLSRTTLYAHADFNGGELKTRLVKRRGQVRGKRFWSRASIESFLDGEFFCCRCGDPVTNENIGGTDDERGRESRSPICEKCVQFSIEKNGGAA